MSTEMVFTLVLSVLGILNAWMLFMFKRIYVSLAESDKKNQIVAESFYNCRNCNGKILKEFEGTLKLIQQEIKMKNEEQDNRITANETTVHNTVIEFKETILKTATSIEKSVNSFINEQKKLNEKMVIHLAKAGDFDGQ